MGKTVYLGSTLPLQRNNRGYFQTTSDPLTNEKSKLINLILTRKGERVSNPNFGCDLWRLLFEQKNEDIQELAQQYVIDAVETFMPYLVLQKIEITNADTFNSDSFINLYVKYGFSNNPLASDELQVMLGTNMITGRLVTSNIFDAQTDPAIISKLGRRVASNGQNI